MKCPKCNNALLMDGCIICGWRETPKVVFKEMIWNDAEKKELIDKAAREAMYRQRMKKKVFNVAIHA